MLSVGALDPEKNPLLLADVLAPCRSGEDPRWRLEVCGERTTAGRAGAPARAARGL